MAANSGHKEHHIIPFKTYATILGILLFMTVVTLITARMDFGALNAWIAMAIASFKAGLVLLYFMHLKYDDKMYPTIFLTSIFFLFVMYGFSQLDIVTRILEFDVIR